MKSILDQTPVSALSPWKSLPGDIDPSKVECSFLIFGKSSKTGKYKPLQLHLIGKKIVLTNVKTFTTSSLIFDRNKPIICRSKVAK